MQMHKIIKEHDLKGCVRWLVAQKSPRKNGELYRVIAGRACQPQPITPQAGVLLDTYYSSCRGSNPLKGFQSRWRCRIGCDLATYCSKDVLLEVA